jgi:hypothetical protein
MAREVLMLAAVPAPEARVLELFRLALAIAQSEKPVPERLAAYFQMVLAQARQLANDPTIRLDSAMPEAIQLALDIRERADLRSAVQDIDSMENVTPSKAAAVLRHLEEMSAP